jgi:uncharacterized protein (DUF1501 family)
MKRREFLSTVAAAGAAFSLPPASFGAALASAKHFAQPHFNFAGNGVLPCAATARKRLVLIELKGGNDGLNTVVPYADPFYYRLRPRLAVSRDTVLPLDERVALHPALDPLMPLWQSGQLAIVQGLGYPRFNLSHFRAMEIWDTASDAHRYLRDGWLARAFAHGFGATSVASFAQGGAPLRRHGGGFVIGTPEQGPLAGAGGAVTSWMPSGGAAMERAPCAGQSSPRFSAHAFGAALGTAMNLISTSNAARAPLHASAINDASNTGNTVHARAQSGLDATVIRVTLNGFDTHANQRERHAVLLAQFAQGIEALHAALRELGLWDDTLVVTYSEFGRRPRENDTGGTEHGSSAPHFVIGGRVRGGLYGTLPALSQLDGTGNLPMAVDFRCLYATVLGSWWGGDAAAVLERRFEPLPLLRV